MATSTTAQDVMRCDLCETNIVQMHCDTCLVNLCKACVGEHFSKDVSKAHKIVDFKDRKSTLIFPQCPNHSNSLCESFCNDCNIPLCVRCIISSDTHKEHQLSIISDIYDSKKKVIQKDFKELQELIVPSYQNIASNLQFRMSQLESIYEYTTTVITKHGEKWHKEIDRHVNRLTASVKKMKTKHINALKEHQDDILKKIEKIHDAEQQCQNLEASNDISLTLNYTSLNEEYKNLPPKPVGSFPVFTPIQVKDATSKFTDLFGNLTNLSITSEKHGYCMKASPKSPEAGSHPQVKQHLYQPIQTPLRTFHWWQFEGRRQQYASFVTKALNSSEEIWKTRNNDIKLFSRSQISLVKSVIAKLPNSFTDIAVISCGDFAYINYGYRTISIVQNDKTEVVALENWRPHCICSTPSDDFLVILVSEDRKQTKLVRYSGSTETQTIQYDDEGNPLYSSRCQYISENRNLDICVVDYGAVVVVNQAGKLRFRYTGHTPAPKNKPFRPKGITTDSQSYILTSDYENDCIHILDQDGQFLRYIDSDCQFSYHPEGLFMDTSDNLFVLLTEHKFFKLDNYKYLM